MKIAAIVTFAAVLLFALPDPAAAVAYCPAEYQSCDGGGGYTGGDGGGGGSGIRDGSRTFGYPYSQCSTAGKVGARCWECVFNPDKRTYVCGGVQHSASCSCTETYSNYIITSCRTYGHCTYY